MQVARSRSRAQRRARHQQMLLPDELVDVRGRIRTASGASVAGPSGSRRSSEPNSVSMRSEYRATVGAWIQTKEDPW